MKNKSVLFLTANNLATNPRLVKELKTAVDLDASLTVVQFKLGNWSDRKSEEMKEVVRGELIEVSGERTVVSDESQVERSKLRGVNAKRIEIEFIEIDATSNQKISWLKWGLLEKLTRWIYPLFKNNLFINALASSRRSLQITNALKKTDKPDLIIAHNLGALYPAYKLAQKWNIPFIFDIEDYHPGEFIRSDAKNEKARREFLMKTLLPKATAITSASPLIGKYTLDLIGGHPNHQVILNSFPQSEFRPPHSHSALRNSASLRLTAHLSSQTSLHSQLTTQASLLTSHIPLCGTPLRYDSLLTTTSPPLKLVWFSQKISFGRGLEQLFEALEHLLTAHHFPNQNQEEEGRRSDTKHREAERQRCAVEPENLNLKPETLYPQPKTQNSQLSTLNLNLTLIGDLDPSFNQQIIEPFLEKIETHNSLTLNPSSGLPSPVSLSISPPLSQPALHAELANHDIGLALEPGKDLNNNLAISNKIIAYAQAGLYIFATDTPAQKAFMDEQPQWGVVCGQTPRAMAEALKSIIEHKQQIQQQAMERFEKGKELAWEKEREKLKVIWDR